jgi:hypothetical protein
MGSMPGLSRRDDQVDLLVEEHLLSQSVGGRAMLSAGGLPSAPGVPGFWLVPEDQRHVHVAGFQHAQCLRRLGLGEPQVNAGVLGVQHGSRRGHDRPERRRERRQPQPAGPQARVRGELVLGGVQPPDDLPCPLGEQPSSVGEPDAPACLLDELRPGLRL